MYKLFNCNNEKIQLDSYFFNVVYADYIYENLDFSWVFTAWEFLKEDGIFIAQTDHHSIFELYGFMKANFKEYPLLNHVVWKNEWGNFPKDRFNPCFDDILIYAKGEHKFYPEKIQVPKATAKTKLNPSGRETKTATAWIDDICLTTTSKERVKKADGHLIRWQKPVELFERIVGPFTQSGDTVLDFFMGSGSLGEYCIRNGLYYVGIENDKEVFDLASTRLKQVQEEEWSKYGASI